MRKENQPGSNRLFLQSVLSTEEALKRSEENFHGLIDAIDEGFILLEVLFDENDKPVDLLYLEANAAAVRMTGTELVGKTTRELDPAYESHWYEVFGTVAKTGVSVRNELSAAPLNVVYTFYAFKVGGENDRRVGVLYHDVTEERRQRDRLRRSEARQTFLLNASDSLRFLSDPISVQEEAGRLIAERIKTDRVFYATINEVEDYILVERDHVQPGVPSIMGKYPLRAFSWVQPALRQDTQAVVVNDIHNSPLIPPGQRQAVADLHVGSFIAAPLIKSGRLVAAFVVTDILPRVWTTEEADLVHEIAERTWAAVERARAEEAVRISEARLHTLADTAPQLIWTDDAFGRSEFFNQRWYVYTGLSEAESRGRGWQAIVHPDDADHSVQLWREALRSGKEFETQFRLRRNDGQYCWHLGRNVPVFDESGMLNAWVGSATDISEIKSVERQKDGFISIASHELKTPVTTLKAYAEILYNRFSDEGRDDEMQIMGKIVRQVDRLTNLIKDLLDTTKLAEGILPLRLEEYDLNEFISERLEEWHRISAFHQIEFHPGPIEKIKADRERISQVLVNLVSNAVKYSSRDSRVIIATEPVENGVRVSVQDFGIGIPEDMQRKVFDRFFRVNHFTALTYPGMGLGLYITAGIVQRHGGTISVQSREGQGSTFSFILPASRG